MQEGIRISDQAAFADTEALLLDDEGHAFESQGQKKQALDTYKVELKRAREARLPYDQQNTWH